MDQDVKDWLVRLTESEAANSKAIELLTNHWTEIKATQKAQSREISRQWKVIAFCVIPIVVSLIVKMWV